MKRRTIVAAGAVCALAAGGAGVATAIGSGDDGEHQATGPGADRATAAALEVTGGGNANAVERDSAHGATWEVEITKPDGKTVDVYLDEGYDKVAVEGDSEKSDSDD